jgi:hypothetical protein
MRDGKVVDESEPVELDAARIGTVEVIG